MTQWRVRYLDAGSRCVAERLMPAASEAAVRAQLAELGHVPIRVRAARWALSRRGATLDLRSFCLEFRALLRAGLGIVGSLEALAEAQIQPAHRQGVEAVLRQVRQGKALSQALAAADEMFPPIFRAAVAAGEASATLPDALERFAEYLTSVTRLRQSVVSASIYPAVVVAFGLAVVLFLMAYVIPRFAVAYESLPELSASGAATLLKLSMLVSEHLQLVLVALIAAGWLTWRRLSSAAGRAAWWRRLSRWRPVAAAVRAYWMARLFRTVSMMLAGGYSVPQALALGRQVLGSTPWVEDLDRTAAQVEVGKSVSVAMQATGLVRGLTQRLVSAGDAAGNLSEMLQHAAEHHERQLALFVERSARVVEPVLLILVAGLIGVVVLLMYMPIFDLASTLG